MQWLSLLSAEPALPAHCEPTTEFLSRFSSAFHVCVPTPLAFTSNAFGALSIVAWLFAQLPQIYKNWAISSTSGLSIFFLVEWFLGDFSNLFGALFTHQAPWQVAIGCYYVFVDFCLVSQWIWYERLKHGDLVRVISRKKQGHDDHDPSHRPETSSNAAGKQPTRPQVIFRAPTFDRSKAQHDDEKPTTTPGGTKVFLPSSPSSAFPSPSPRTVLLIACIIHIATARASPVSHTLHTTTPPHHPTPLENAGTFFSWLSTILYLFSRVPQLLKNFRRKSTSGLSPHLFIAAFCGNLCYSAALLTNPCAWSDLPAHGGNGWVGSQGSLRSQWVAAAMPFFLGAAGVLGLDASMGLQFLMYGERTDAGQVKVVVIGGGVRVSRWRRVSGWMRGWIPSMSDLGDSRAASLGVDEAEERERSLLRLEDGGRRRDYGGTSA